jgi:uncharacterized peroxidase-related enzyme
VHAHAADLRAEVEDLPADERLHWVASLARDWRSARLPEPDAALCAFAVKLTRTPAAMQASDLDALREHGLDDESIHQAIQVTSYFNYINRVADAVHVDLEPEMPPYPD